MTLNITIDRMPLEELSSINPDSGVSQLQTIFMELADEITESEEQAEIGYIFHPQHPMLPIGMWTLRE